MGILQNWKRIFLHYDNSSKKKNGDILRRKEKIMNSTHLSMRDLFTCMSCKEDRYHALRQKGVHSGYCHNCTYKGDRFVICFACGCLAPYELHHIIPQRLHLDTLASTCTIPLCLNCHKVVTQQYEHLIWERYYFGIPQTITHNEYSAKKILWELCEERYEFYQLQSKPDYSILTSTYQQSYNAERREKRDYKCNIQ